MTDLTNLISAAVAAKMTPEFITKEIDTRVEKLIVESVASALRSYSDTGKLIEAAIADALRVDRLDLPSYGTTVAAILKAQIEAKVAPLVAGQLAADMDEILGLAPATIKLSKIAEEMCKRHQEYHSDAWGDCITVAVERSEYGSVSVFLDEDEHLEGREIRRAKCDLHIGKDGRLLSARISERDLKSTSFLRRSYGLEQQIRAWFACGTVIELDEDNVITGIGDY